MKTDEESKTTPPNYAAQNVIHDFEERKAWIKARADEAKLVGCTWPRITGHPTINGLILFEAWKVKPKREPEPFFFLRLENPDA